MLSIDFDVAVLMIATATGFIMYSKKDKLYFKLLPFFLLFDVIAELVGQVVARHGMSNVMVFNLYSVAEFSFYLYFFREAIDDARASRRIRIAEIILPLLCLVNIFFVQGIHQFHTYTFSTGSLVMVSLGILYIYRLFQSREHINILRDPPFWVSIGVIFFFVSSLSMVGVMNYLNELPRNIINNIMMLIQTFAVFFYIFLIIAFLCRRNIRKS